MFNLPWYAWLNVLALPCLWLYLMLDCALQSKPKWFRQYTSFSLLACVCTLFLYWNPSVNALFIPLQIGLTIVIVPFVLWTQGTAGALILEYSVSWIRSNSTEPQDALVSTQARMHQDLNADDIDLDGGVSPSGHSEQCGKSVSGLFSKEAGLDDSVKNVMTLIGSEIKDDTPQAVVSALLIQLAFTSIILIPPLMASFKLLP